MKCTNCYDSVATMLADKLKAIETMSGEIQTLRAKVEVLEEYKNAVIDHFIVAFHGYDESKSVYDNLSLLIACHQELALDPKVSKEASDLHAKVASADALVGALREARLALLSRVLMYESVRIIEKAIAKYNKLIGVKHD